ncbi:hypothetical protein BU23DRAFT_600913 [Bimuria novae-zelandiae CBS 107.79]|uniref:Uncharacterized protein n=1 Tax=Bimuria novae-zelandiae CBS 107.79 TaxID=1447943 RepID=A0A6A5V1M7_9PLEO|nr:hypothetical protein BU23DRAFT_600913 [Bimuria novae-zelandiae CBS 107.79]
MSQSPTDSLATIEDNTLYEEVYNAKEGVPRDGGSREGVSREELATPHGGVLSRVGLVSQDGKRVDRLNKKRVHFQDSDSDVDDSRPSARKVSKAEESSALRTATKMIQILEARIGALEEWKAKCEEAIQKKAKMNKEFMQDLTALLKASHSGE